MLEVMCVKFLFNFPAYFLPVKWEEIDIFFKPKFLLQKWYLSIFVCKPPALSANRKKSKLSYNLLL